MSRGPRVCGASSAVDGVPLASLDACEGRPRRSEAGRHRRTERTVVAGDVVTAGRRDPGGPGTRSGRPGSRRCVPRLDAGNVGSPIGSASTRWSSASSRWGRPGGSFRSPITTVRIGRHVVAQQFVQVGGALGRGPATGAPRRTGSVDGRDGDAAAVRPAGQESRTAAAPITDRTGGDEQGSRAGTTAVDDGTSPGLRANRAIQRQPSWSTWGSWRPSTSGAAARTTSTASGRGGAGL